MSDPIISTFGDLYKAGSDEITIRNDKLTARQSGSVIDALLGAMAAIADEALLRALRKILETYFDTAEGAALDKLALDHLSLTRNFGAAAVGALQLTRPDTTGGTGAIPIGARFSTQASSGQSAIEFETIETKQMTGTTVSVAARAVLVGTTGNVGASTVAVVKSSLFDSSITVDNPLAFAGGADAESDPAFRDRIKGYLETLRRGTPSAVVFGAKTVGGVATANLDESTAGLGYITIYIADLNGTSNAQLIAAVQLELENWRAAGVTVNVGGAVVIAQAITFTPTYEAGVDTDAVKLKAIDAVLAYRDTLNVGEILYFSKLNAAIQAVDGIVGVTVTVPAGNVAPTPQQIIRGGAITVT